MSNCRNNRRRNYNRPSRCNRRSNYNRYDRYNRSDVMGDRRVPPGGEPCPYKTPRAWQDSRYDRPCR